MTEKTLTTENIKPALDALRGELAPWPVVAKKQDRLNDTQKSAVNSGITSSLVAQIIANTAAIRALESAITGTGLRALVVSSLPAIGTQGILYIVPVTTYDPETDADVVNYSNEYIWIPVEGGTASEGHYEQVGQTGIVINNGQLTITVNGTSVGTFTANQSGDTTAAITVPTNADYVDLSTSQTVTGGKTWTGEQSFTLPIVGSITGTASKAIADEDGTSIKTGYGKLAGNQTWTGTNTFTNNLLTRDPSSVSAGSYGKGINFYDSTSTRYGYIQPHVTTDNSRNLTLGADTGHVELGSHLVPYLNSGVSLGQSSLRWSSVYADSYYYGTTAWGLDKANTWTNENIFSVGDYGQSIWLKNTTLDLSVNGNTGLSSTYQHIVKWVDKNNTAYSIIQSWTNSFENVLVLRSYYRTDANTLRDSSVRNLCSATTKAFYPETNADTELGTSTNKWKTLNGINPGALSLPDYSSAVNIDTTNWSTAGAMITYTPTVYGWLQITVPGGSGNYMTILDSGTTPRAGQRIIGDGIDRLYLTYPVVANHTYWIYIISSSIATARIIPCLGNV